MTSCKNHPLCKLLYRNTGHVRLTGFYRVYLGNRKGLKIWIVDGPMVRRELYGDFSMGGNSLKYPFVPKDEIWLDSAMTPEQVHFTPVQELEEVKCMTAGKSYAEAYE